MEESRFSNAVARFDKLSYCVHYDESDVPTYHQERGVLELSVWDYELGSRLSLIGVVHIPAREIGLVKSMSYLPEAEKTKWHTLHPNGEKSVQVLIEKKRQAEEAAAAAAVAAAAAEAGGQVQAPAPAAAARPGAGAAAAAAQGVSLFGYRLIAPSSRLLLQRAINTSYVFWARVPDELQLAHTMLARQGSSTEGVDPGRPGRLFVPKRSMLGLPMAGEAEVAEVAEAASQPRQPLAHQ